MPITYGQIRMVCARGVENADLDLLDFYLQGRLTEVLGKIPWARQEAQASISLPPAYREGTVIASKGIADITLNVDTGAIWTPDMDGRAISFGGSSSSTYIFSYGGPAAGKLDRPFQGDDTTAGEYTITCFRVPRPPNALVVDGVIADRRLTQVTHQVLRDADPTRWATGDPEVWAPHGLFIEFWPPSEDLGGIMVDYVEEAAAPDSAAKNIVSWIRPLMLGDGVMADLRRQAGRLSEANSYEQRFDSQLADLVLQDAQQNGAQEIVADAAYTGGEDYSVPRGLKTGQRRAW